MAVLGVVPREERAAVTNRRLDAEETAREAGMVLQGLKLRFRERIVIGDLRTAQGSRHSEVGEQLRGALARHRCASVRVQRQHLGFDPLLVAGLFDQATSQGRVLSVGHHPAHHVAAEDVEQDVEVVVGPLLRPQ